jgi:hypothetical protein
MTHMIINIDGEAYTELKAAIVNGAFEKHHASLVARMQNNKGNSSADHYEKRIDHLDRAAVKIIEAISEETYDKGIREETMPWLKMTDDDWIHAANFMIARAERELPLGHGGFMTAWYESQLALGRAHIRADLSNQRKVRSQHGLAFYFAHLERLAEKKAD